MAEREKELELDRLVFFSDAIVAIAITLLALELKIDLAKGEHLTFRILLDSWQKFVAFFLSFFMIALFWRIHHRFFSHIRSIDNAMLWYNVIWLMFIVLLPFTTSLISSHFYDRPAMFCYCLNIFIITIFQNNIWDHAAASPALLKEKIQPETIHYNRVACNVAMLNGLIASGVALLNPLIAFLLLFLRLPMIFSARKIFSKRFQQMNNDRIK